MLLKPLGAVGSSGPEAVELAAQCGMRLDPWQELLLEISMAENAAGLWAASEVGLIASRQNGKNGGVEARELFGLAILHEWIIHTSHLFKTTKESYDRLMALVEGNPDVKDCLISSVASPASGYEMRFRGGGRITFIARSRSSGRGLTGDLLVCDEAQDMTDEAQGALLPVISARPGAQVWYLGSAPGLGSTVMHRVRTRGRQGLGERFAYLEFSADPEADLDDREGWAQANPALGDRITEEAIEAERASMSDEMFARERLSISPDLLESGGIFGKAWAGICDPDLQVEAELFAFDVNPERSAAAIVAIGAGPTVEVVDYRPGVAWLEERIIELKDRYHCRFALDKNGPAGAFVEALERKRVRLVELDSRDMVRACGAFFDRVMDQQLRIRANNDLDAAVAGAVKREVADAWAWGRKKSFYDISLLVAATAGVWAHANKTKSRVVSLAAALEEAEKRSKNIEYVEGDITAMKFPDASFDGLWSHASLVHLESIEDVEKKGFEPMALRYLYLTAHYRDPLNFTWTSLEAAQNGLNN